jgi:Zn-dependent alcohol dehydrogenase
MKTRAAVLRKGGTPWEITEVDLDEPKAGEVLIRMEAAGLCHSDEHIRSTPLYDIPMILGLWQSGDIKLSELVTQRYTLDRINEGYQDMMDGKNIRGVIVHEH